MLHQTQVARVAAVYDDFLARFPTPAAMAEAGPGAVITAWGRLGYPRRARRLWEAAVVIAADGWPDDLTALPGVGRYTAGAVAAQADDADVPARRGERAARRRAGARRAGSPTTDAERGDRARSGARCADATGCSRSWTSARCCAARATRVAPSARSARRCATRGPLADERRSHQAPFEGSFRQRRGHVMAKLREGPAPAADVDADALASLVDDGLAVVGPRLPRRPAPEAANGAAADGSPASDVREPVSRRQRASE